MPRAITRMTKMAKRGSARQRACGVCQIANEVFYRGNRIPFPDVFANAGGIAKLDACAAGCFLDRKSLRDVVVHLVPQMRVEFLC